MLVKTNETTFDHPEYKELARDLATSSSRQLFLTVTLVSSFWVLMITLAQAGQISLEILPIGFAIGITYWLVNRLAGINLIVAQVTWLVMFSATVAIGLMIFRRSEIAYLLALIPMMAIVMIGWQAALASGVLVAALLAALNLMLGEVAPVFQISLICFGGALAGLIGWSAMSPLLTVVGWTNYSYRMARDHLEEARNQRVELKQVQEDLLLANKELVRLTNSLKVMTYRAEEARRVKEEFVANVSHELRTPLNMIIGYTNLILKSPTGYGKRLPARLLADISSIQRNSQHLVELINDVLDLSQVDAGRMALARAWTSINEIVDSAVTAVQPLFISKQLYLEKYLPDEKLLVYCDGTRIREVILNLLSNAGRFTEQGGVVLRAWKNNDQLLISVRDSGTGISKEDQQRIFEPFQQLDPMLHHSAGGSGLGLTISKQFVEMHEGKMWLESLPGVGTTFYFSIPVEPGISMEESVTSASRWINPVIEYQVRDRPNKAPHPEYAPRIVVVEEDGTVKRIIERNLTRVDVVSAPSLEQAFQITGGGSVQLLIFNQPPEEALPDTSSWITMDTPVVTCWIPGREEAARRLGVIQYLVKPTPQEVLLNALDALSTSEMNILLVDDDQETLQLYARIFSVARPGYHIIRATNGKEALALMKERLPDAVILDLTMPVMSGFDVLKEKSEDPAISSIPVIVVSSTDPAGMPVMSNQIGVWRSNGFTTQEFLNCLSAVSEGLNSFSPGRHPAQPKNAPE